MQISPNQPIILKLMIEILFYQHQSLVEMR